jgi:seryl-tRNA synthetase
VAAPLREQLTAIVDTYRSLSAVDDKLATRHEQMSVLRERVDELSGQLVGLRKVKRAQELSGHLAERMEQLGDKLDALTVEVTELETDRLKARIELQNMVAELTLRDEGEAAGGTASAAP